MSMLQARRTYIAQQRQTVDKLNKGVKRKMNQVVFFKVKTRVEINSSQILINFSYILAMLAGSQP